MNAPKNNKQKKFKLHCRSNTDQFSQTHDQQKLSDLSKNILNEIDRKFESMTFSTTNKLNHNSLNDENQSHSVDHKSYKDNSSEKRKGYAQLSKRLNKIQNIQQAFDKFQQAQSVDYVKTEQTYIEPRAPPSKKGKEISQIINCLEERLSHSSKSTQGNKRDSINKDILHQLQIKDANQRLDISNLKKQNSELKQKYDEALKQILEMDKIQKRDNEYILKMDNTLQQMKQKLKQVQTSKDQLSKELRRVQTENKDLREEITQIREFIENNQIINNFNYKNIEMEECDTEKNFFITQSPQFIIKRDSGQNNSIKDEKDSPSQIPQIEKNTIRIGNMINKVKMQKRSLTCETEMDDKKNCDLTISSLVSQIEDDQQYQGYSMSSQTQQNQQLQQNQTLQRGEKLYTQLVENLISKNDEDKENQHSQYLELFEIKQSKQQTKESNVKKSLQLKNCGSQQSNFSFAQNSDQKKITQFNSIESNLSTIQQQTISPPLQDQKMIQQLLCLNAKLSEQITSSKISKEQANRFINYLQSQVRVNSSMLSNRISSTTSPQRSILEDRGTNKS